MPQLKNCHSTKSVDRSFWPLPFHSKKSLPYAPVTRYIFHKYQSSMMQKCITQINFIATRHFVFMLHYSFIKMEKVFMIGNEQLQIDRWLYITFAPIKRDSHFHFVNMHYFGRTLSVFTSTLLQNAKTSFWILVSLEIRIEKKYFN